ncbi:unnamed protein product, partial [marine sediment metagenome]
CIYNLSIYNKHFQYEGEICQKDISVKNFIFHFMTVGTEWIDMNTLRLYT